MDPLPHHYPVHASCEPDAEITVEVKEKPALLTGAAKEFGGPGTAWSPEDLLVSAVVDCYMLSFKAVAKASRFAWQSLQCDAVGTLDKVDQKLQFTAFQIKVKLVAFAETDHKRAERMLRKSEQICLITNSLKAPVELVLEIE